MSKNNKKNKSSNDVKSRSALVFSVKTRLSGAGVHSDKRFRRNSKGRKYDVSYGYEA